MNAYLSTPKFVKTLTDISNELITVANRDEYLQEELLKLNRQLPAAVYIPFVNGNLSIFAITLRIESIRNYAILHIVTDEAKVFQTKERAPLLLCLEAFRPEEMMVSDIPRQLSVIKETNNRKSKPSGGDAAAKRGPKTMPNAEYDYVNYRSSSWDSSKYTPAD